MRRTLFLRASLSLSFGWLAFSASGQVTMTTTATNSGKSYLGVDNRAVVTNIDTLFARLNALSSLTWGDVLDNGAQASQDPVRPGGDVPVQIEVLGGLSAVVEHLPPREGAGRAAERIQPRVERIDVRDHGPVFYPKVGFA